MGVTPSAAFVVPQVAAFQNERVDVVSNDYGNRTTPCLVLYDPATQEHLIGEPAVAKAAKLQASPEATALTPAKIAQVQMSKMKTDAEAFIGQVRRAACDSRLAGLGGDPPPPINSK